MTDLQTVVEQPFYPPALPRLLRAKRPVTVCYAAPRVDARWHPRGTPKAFGCFKALAPGDWFKSLANKEYSTRHNNEVLGDLDPQETYDKLVELAAGAEPVLLCWEYPPFPGHRCCHRQLVAAWFQRTLGIVVPEISWPELVTAETESEVALAEYDAGRKS